MLKNLIKKNKFLFKLALDFKESQLNPNYFISRLSELERNYLEILQKDGVVAIPSFFSQEECDLLIEEFERLDEKYAVYNEDKRIYAIEHLSEKYKQMFHDIEMFKKVGEAYIGDELVLQTTMAAKIVPNEKEKYGSGGGWHRDSFSRQFKAIAYLDNVEIENGPFMYIKTSHTMENIKKVIDQLEDHIPGDFRYSDDEIKRCQEILQEEITYFTAPKGTLVLADIRGLHTGKKIKKGHRYSVFNYYIAKSYHQPNNIIEQLAQTNINKSKQ